MWQQVRQALVDATARFLTRLASLLPGIAALIVAVVISVLVAWILAMILRRLLTSLRFDERLGQWGWGSLAEWSPRNSPTMLVSRSVAGLVVLSGFLIGIAAFDFEWTYLLVQNTFAYFPNLLAAFLVLLVGNIIARFLARSVLIGAVNLNLQYARFLSIGVKWLVIVLAVAMALEHLRIAPGVVQLAFGILFGGIVLSMALAVGLGSKEFVTKSLERENQKETRAGEPVEADPLHHL
jgi:ABC-type multidrug transport system fused ATPase/permease subunit